MSNEGKERRVPLSGEQFTTKQSPLRSQKKQMFQKLVLAHSDVHAAYKTCELFGKMIASRHTADAPLTAGMEDPLYFPLLQAIVISYARPFTNNDGVGVLPKRWSRFDDPELLQAHKMLLKYRNELVAHSDKLVRRIQIHGPDADYGPKVEGKRMAGPGFAVRGFGIRLGQVEVFYRLCAHQGNRLWREVEKLLDELYGGMELPNKVFDLRITEGL